MTTFFSFLKQHIVPRKSAFTRVFQPLTWHGVGLSILLGLILITSYLLILKTNDHFLVTIPARGGTVIEGVLGAPHLINPVLATTETDVALTTLLFSGLVKEQADGTIAPELAQSFTVSPNGLQYTFILRNKLQWSDGTALTSADVAFTASKLANPITHSQVYWQDITVTTPDQNTIIFNLPQERSDFLKQATVGILPQHIWKDVPDDVFDSAPENLKPVGSGPYTFKKITYQNNLPEEIILKRNTHYALKHPLIDRYQVRFFANQQQILDALNTKAITMTMAASPSTVDQARKDLYQIKNISNPLQVGLFHLKTESVFADQRFLAILDASIDKNAILATVEHGYGLLSSTSMHTDKMSLEDTFAALQRIGYIYSDGILKKNGVPVGFSIGVENDPSLLVGTRLLASDLGRFGILVTVKAFDRGTFQESVIKNEYQLFFASIRTDSLPKTYEPVFTLYTKTYPFIYNQSLHIAIPDYLDSPNDRYLENQDWYIRTNKVWNYFSKKTNITSNN
jgi:peptide/nickel transport system substrate-binding protein